MRIPVSPSDLKSGFGFKRVAKVLSRDWPGPKPLKLSLAREILAKAFGYSDYHDVITAAKTWVPAEGASPTVKVQTAIQLEIIKVGQEDTAMSIPSSSLAVLVHSLPLYALSAIDMPSASTRPSKRTPATPSMPSLEHLRAFTPPHTTEENSTEASTNKVRIVPGLKTPPVLSPSEIQHIAQVVNQHGTLRDRALLAVMLSGLRTIEVMNIKVGHVSVLERAPEQPLWVAKVKMRKSPDIQERIHVLNTSLLAPMTGDLIEEYLSSSTLSKDDFLFPSRKDPKQPMSAAELARICKNWSVLAKFEPGIISASTFRRSTIPAIAAAYSTDQLSAVTGHKSPSSLLGYIKRSPKPSE